jgi:hypothetical protein
VSFIELWLRRIARVRRDVAGWRYLPIRGAIVLLLNVFTIDRFSVCENGSL